VSLNEHEQESLTENENVFVEYQQTIFSAVFGFFTTNRNVIEARCMPQSEANFIEKVASGSPQHQPTLLVHPKNEQKRRSCESKDMPHGQEFYAQAVVIGIFDEHSVEIAESLENLKHRISTETEHQKLSSTAHFR
jgi:hypothetical protein